MSVTSGGSKPRVASHGERRVEVVAPATHSRESRAVGTGETEDDDSVARRSNLARDAAAAVGGGNRNLLVEDQAVSTHGLGEMHTARHREGHGEEVPSLKNVNINMAITRLANAPP